MQRLSAKHLLSTAVLAFALLQGAAVGAAELPTYEVSSFPATPLQLSVMGSAGVQEQTATPTLTRNAMPASPHQLEVLTPRHGTVRAANAAATGAAQ
ncbi:hypothetical protein [Bradyrhizobium sp.]|jgi:hypothetical protein|uniref:hypothetical protein n=1 Tax=Bradyrhizobium sp. TaxID=376 RepID=UPI003C25785A